ncbi:unnamed protein product [Ectocarpus sp. 12 AP-2014]
MKIFSHPTAIIFAVLSVARVQAQECIVSSLSDAAQEQLSMYDKGLYLEPDCVNGASPMPVHCNYMGLGQECRGCFMTCDGATRYLDDFAEEISVWGVDAIVHFCPDAEVELLEEC